MAARSRSATPSGRVARGSSRRCFMSWVAGRAATALRPCAWAAVARWRWPSSASDLLLFGHPHDDMSRPSEPGSTATTEPGARAQRGAGAQPGAGAKPGALTLSEDDRRVLADWAADCAERTLPLFEAQAPGDSRPRDAIDGARAFARGELRVGPARTLAVAAHAAARAVADPAAVAAARAAGHAVAVAHMASHARGVAYAAIAAGLGPPADPSAVANQARWQQGHLTPAASAILAELPAPPRSGGTLSALQQDLHAH